MYEAQADFKPTEGDMPDTMSRFHMDEAKEKPRTFQDSDLSNMLMTFLGMGVVSMIVLNSQKSDQEKLSDEELGAATDVASSAKTTLLKEDVVDQHLSIQATYTGDKIVKTHQKTQETLMSKKELMMKRAVDDADLLIIEKPKVLREVPKNFVRPINPESPQKGSTFESGST